MSMDIEDIIFGVELSNFIFAPTLSPDADDDDDNNNNNNNPASRPVPLLPRREIALTLIIVRNPRGNKSEGDIIGRDYKQLLSKNVRAWAW